MSVIAFSEKQAATIRKPYWHTLEVNEGTPRSGKTTAGIFRAARFYLTSEDANHLIVAYTQELAYKLYMEGDGMGLMHIFDRLAALRDGYLELNAPRGIRRIYYRGGGKADSARGITGLSFGSVVFCEIDLLHPDMIQECFRRTFAAKHRWHLADLNPPPPNHPVIRDVFETQDTDWQHWTVADNPAISTERAEEIRRVCLKNPLLYARDWLGQRVQPVGAVYSLFDPARHIAREIRGKIVELFFAGDGGQGDATSLSCNLVARGDDGAYRLYRAAHYYHSGHDTGLIKPMSAYARELAAFMRRCEGRFRLPASAVLIDPACRALREELHAIGIPTDPADNNRRDTGGIETGIERMQSALADGRFYLLDADEAGHAAFLREISLYCRGTMGKPVDAHNHALDEARYAINHFIRHYPTIHREA